MAVQAENPVTYSAQIMQGGTHARRSCENGLARNLWMADSKTHARQGDGMSRTNIEILLDKRSLDDLIYRQAVAVDLHDWDTYRSCFDDEVYFDFTDHTDRVIGKGFGVVTSGDVWVSQVIQAIGGFDSTSHVITNAVHDVVGDVAESSCLIVADHFLNNDNGDRYITMAGVYQFTSTRTPNGWKIKKWTLKILWYRGNPVLYKLAGEKRVPQIQ